MKKLIISLLAITLSCIAGQLNINYNTGSPTTIELSDIASINFILPSMITVPGGTFQMGSDDNAPIHTVTLSSFLIGRYEVTQMEWAATMGSNPSSSINGNSPVDMISLYDVMVYCNKRSKAENLTPCYTISGSTNPTIWGDIPTIDNAIWNAAICNWNANGYRVPTEAEWEFAAKGGNSSKGYKYAGSNNVDSVAWYSLNSGSKIHAVGAKTPNELVLYDMSGNVIEWNWDFHGEYSPNAQTNPHGQGSGSLRVVRGGYISYDESFCRVTKRATYYQDQKLRGLGLRLARTL